MEILNFLKWQWNRYDQFNKCVVFVSSVTITATLIAGLLYGLTIAFGTFLFTTASVSLSTLLVMILIINPWRKYKAEKETEAQRILNKLSGRQQSYDYRGPG